MKEKESLDVVIGDLELNPKCPHGPTILFSRKNGKKFFSCSFDRSNSCFYLEFEQFEKNKDKILNSKIKFASNEIEDLHQLAVNERIFCITCNKFIRSIQSHESHSYKIINEKFLQEPSLFLPQLDNDKNNAQYFFNEQSLNFFVHILRNIQLTKIICIGAPRLHDFIRNQKDNKFSSILLDIDQRFEAFYPEEFLHFNMLNNFFFNKSRDQLKLINFLKQNASNDNISHHCIFTDPPFASRIELLTQTLKQISHMYFTLCKKVIPIFLIFPYFNENHIKNFLPEMEMLDYQVAYTNHYAFNENYKGRREGSPIRVFTNIDQSIIKYPLFLKNYRRCNKCKRFVAQNNFHCKVCNICPSKNGATYRHCDRCIKCVKPNYIHCKECDRCVQKLNHNCKVYQSHQKCWYCLERGHVERFCKFMKGLRQSCKNGICRICLGTKKHNLAVCKSKSNMLNKNN